MLRGQLLNTPIVGVSELGRSPHPLASAAPAHPATAPAGCMSSMRAGR